MLINGILVVEGKDDKAFLSSFITSEIVFVNGMEINESVISYLKSSNKNIYILTDPDSAGVEIRNKIKKSIPSAIDIFVNKNDCNKHNKHGVAEANKTVVEQLLKPYETAFIDSANEIDLNFLYSLGVFNNGGKQKILDKYNLGFCSTKQMIKRLNSLSVKRNDIIKLLCK